MTQHEEDIVGENAAYASERRIAEKERANANGNGLFSYLRPSAPLAAVALRVRGLESEQRRITRLRRGALTLLLGM